MSGTRTPKKPQRLKVRAEFLRAQSSGRKASTPAFLLQHAPAPDSSKARYGLTATKKLGNAVVRNRARRRLRALAEKVLVPNALPGDYVLIAREACLTRDFGAMESDLNQALKKLSCLKA